jgi:hypothetical protein
MYRDDPKFIEAHTTDWALGFLSGLNMNALMKEEETRNLKTFSVQGMESRLRRYCDQHPLGNYLDAVMTLYQSMDVVPPKPSRQ